MKKRKIINIDCGNMTQKEILETIQKYQIGGILMTKLIRDRKPRWYDFFIPPIIIDL